MSRQQEISESLIKKRARDRRAQQNLRDKRVAHIESLGQRITALETELQGLRQAYHALWQENEILRSRQEHIQHIVSSRMHAYSLEFDPNVANASPISYRAGRASSLNGVYSGHDTNDYRNPSPTQPTAYQILSGNNTTQVAVSSLMSCKPQQEPNL
ncbi:hypothetical protein F4820DRAFT_442061 [Hypoxylon rubiginosum]|uniref:Uncharacterized protein n=1 Tax=Hypoxylon rubiginosum TaxID=110542 RepID=A0ACB9YGP6_9PEZI|nr:hypothetical protein F4820DRAFT_442061 [Hypoxylon rubiginosum]